MKRIVEAVFLFSALISSADEWKPDPAMTGSFSSSPGERTRAFLDVRADGSVRLSRNDTYGHWEGTILPKEGTEMFVMEAVPVDDGDVPEEEGPVIISMPGENNDMIPAWESTSEKSGTAIKEGSVALLLQFDPIAPAWLEMGYGRDAATIQSRKWYHPISEDGGFRHRQYSSFKDRLVSDVPFPADDEKVVERRLSGVWSNGEDGFGRESIMLATNRFGLFAGGVSAAPVRWSTSEKNGRHYVEFANPLPDKGGDDRYAILFVADLRRELLVRVSETDTVGHAFASMRDPATVRADGRFYRLSETLPEEWAEKISRLPEQIEAHKNGDRFRAGDGRSFYRLFSYGKMHELFAALRALLRRHDGLGAFLRANGATTAPALKITARLAEAFPGDPCKGDFALYGLGIDEEANTK